MMTSEDQRNTDNLNAILTFVGSATILAVVIIAVSRWQKRRGDSKYRYSNVNVKVTKSVQMTKHESIDDITRASAGSDYHQLTVVSYAGYCSFTLIVDGKVCGFIRPNPAEIRVPNGEHDISITTNDVNNKTVYHNRMNLDGVRTMTIRSSGKKYLVEWK